MLNSTTASPILAENYRFLKDYIYRESGIVLDDDKHYLLEARLLPVVQESQLSSLDALCAALRNNGDPPLQKKVVEAMTTHETLFFRDIAPFDALKTSVLPPLIEQRKTTRKISFWSAAASSGQEAYSLAMLLLEIGLSGWNLQILGTDLSEQILERARGGRYMQIEVNRGLPAGLLIKYFRRGGMEWQLNDAAKRLARFETIDLRASLRALGPFDLVFCRNVLIYFDRETKTKILKEIHGTLYRGGWFLLGGAETVFGIEEWFDRENVGNVTVYLAR